MSSTIVRKNSTNNAVVTDDPTDKSEGKETANFFRPHKHDIIPILLAILAICLGIFVGLLSYFLSKNVDYVNAHHALIEASTDAGITLTDAIKASVNVVQSVSSFFSVSPVMLNQDQFKTFVYAGGAMPKFLLGITKLRTVKPEETDAFQAQMRAQGGLYSNFSVTSRDANNNVVYPAVYSPLRCVATNIVPDSVFASGIGYDVSTEALRNASMYKTFATNQPVGTGRVSTVLATGTLNVAVVIFFRTYNYTTNQNDGMIAGTLLMSQLIQETLAPIVLRDVVVSVHDLNATATDVNKGFLLSTNNATNAQNTQSINGARFTHVVTVPFADRTLKVTLYPGPTYIARFDSGNKWIALSLSFFFGLLLLAGSLFLFCGRRLYALRKSKIASSVQIDLLKTNQVALRTLLDRIANQEQKTRAVINALPDYVCVISAAGKIMQTNASFDQVFPFTETEMERGIYTWDIFTELSSDFFRISDENKEIVTVASRRFGDYLDVTVRVRSLSRDSQSSASEQSNQLARSNTNIPMPELEEAYVIICKGSLEIVNPISIEEQSLRNELEKRLRDHVFRQEFKEFCEKNQTSENLTFLEKLREYKKSNFGVRVDMKQSIFETFIKHDAPMQLNLANDVIVEETLKISKSIADVDVFKRVEDCVMKTLTGDVYPRFITNRKGSFVIEK